jgi:hypothetical protein
MPLIRLGAIAQSFTGHDWLKETVPDHRERGGYLAWPNGACGRVDNSGSERSEV